MQLLIFKNLFHLGAQILRYCPRLLLTHYTEILDSGLNGLKCFGNQKVKKNLYISNTIVLIRFEFSDTPLMFLYSQRVMCCII
jgi:hypothetical protein